LIISLVKYYILDIIIKEIKVFINLISKTYEIKDILENEKEFKLDLYIVEK